MKIAVVGGGAAGMMAAIQASGEDVVLLEKNEKLGKKLYITGKGRCNVTNACSEQQLLENIPRNARFMYSAFNTLSPQELCAMVEGLGTPLKTERGGRVFPVSDHSSDIIKAFAKGLAQCGVKVKLNTAVTDIAVKDGKICGLQTDGGFIECDRVILACGGCSYPQTGSDGGGFALARGLGHTVTPLYPALVPINTDDDYLRELQGLSLKNVTFNAYDGKKKLFSQQGELLFTHFGISGPLVLTYSSVMAGRDISKAETYIDLKPALTQQQLDNRLIRDFVSSGGKSLKNVITGLVPACMRSVLLRAAGADGDKRADQLSREERAGIIKALKFFPVHPVSLRGFSEAVITRGGINIKEVNPSTMESRLVEGLYFAGEMLDVDAFTGGYNLQIAFSSGALAGLSASGGEYVKK